MRIKRLDEALIRRIAAGEVVERPASVAKELVENSLDAGASSIDVEIRGGGIDYIRVADDGCGMTPEEMRLAVERHTTSKISREEDLLEIRTLGFRGEALAAICAVAKVGIVSRTPESEAGHELYLEGGRILRDAPAARAPGTTVEVRDLFFNTPARRKFLKSPRTEARYLLFFLRRISLAHPGVRFEIRSEGKPVLSLPPAGGFHERIAQVYGGSFARKLIPVEMEEPGYRLQAFFAPPELHRPTRGDQFLFVSGRPVHPGTLSGALEEVYRRYLPRGGHPVFFIYLNPDPFLVDVNVHPQKTEVRFRNESAVKDLLRRAATAALGRTTPRFSPSPLPQRMAVNSPPVRFCETEQRSLADIPLEEREGRRWRVLGQVKDSYILVETDEGLEIVDQHVAHERILFERLNSEGAVPSHFLLSPIPLEFPPEEAEALREALPRLAKLGVMLEPFGERGFILRGWPAPLAEGKQKRFREGLEAAARRLLQGGEPPLTELWREIACAEAIKAGERLSPAEQEALISEWKSTRDPARCPHGRPVSLLIPWDELERRLGRH